MYIYDVSLNLMSLGGLALGIGMLVDNAVVVLENIQVYLDRGFSRKEAASKGTKEVALAVTTSTLTTISVFLPITFVEGVAGRFFGDLSLAVVFSLLASLAVAYSLYPCLCQPDLSPPPSNSVLPLRNAFRVGIIFVKVSNGTGWKRILWLLWAIPRFLLVFMGDIFDMLRDSYRILLWVCFHWGVR